MATTKKKGLKIKVGAKAPKIKVGSKAPKIKVGKKLKDKLKKTKGKLSDPRNSMAKKKTKKTKKA